eukprot:gene7804-10554_t
MGGTGGCRDYPGEGQVRGSRQPSIARLAPKSPGQIYAVIPILPLSPTIPICKHEHPALSAKDYPLWVIGFGLLVLLAFGYSSLFLPRHVSQARTLARADRLDKAGDYVQAEREYRTLLVGDPASEAGRLGMAHAILADSERAANEAVAKVKIDYEVLEPVLSIDDALKPGAPI